MNNRVIQKVGEVKDGGVVVGTQIVYQGEQVLIPSPEDVQLHRADLAAREEYHRWADECYIREEGKVLPLYASPYEDDTGRKREDLLETIRAHQRLLILGEPGMGKTVAMERIMWEAAQADSQVVPILVSLLYFQGDLFEQIRAALNETGRLAFDNLKSVRAFLRDASCLLLFDGLNEAPGRQRDQVIGAIANFMREYPEHRYVVTSRSQDELWRKLRSSDLIKDVVVIQNINDAQTQSYLQAHLGKEVGQALYDHLDDSLKALARIPLLLWLIKEAGQGSEQLPRNRGELFDKFVMNKLLEREKKLELVETPEIKKKALAHLAFALQQEHQLSCDRLWAESVLAKKGLGDNAGTILSEALLHGFLLQQNLPDNQHLRFIHQSVQEYFVALNLISELHIEKNANFIQMTTRRLTRRDLTTWAKDMWWAESFVKLAGLVEDADWLARKIVNVNPWLAWWCVAEGRDVPDGTREMIEMRSIKLLSSERVSDRLRAVQTLAQIKSDRVLEPLLFAAGDADSGVAGLGVRALVEMEDAARPLIIKSLRGDDARFWRAALCVIRTQPNHPLSATVPSQVWEGVLGQPMVWVPPGSFLMGSDKDSKVSDRELPQHKVTLAGYWIGRYPVIVAQWGAFVRASGHEADERSLKDPDDHPVRYVNWNDALAYCRWLGEQTGLPVSLPSEAEWEKAARGTDGRIYPWGNEFNQNKCNTFESGIRTTTPVGKYSPAGDSPYGCADMSGNVWEWTRSKFEPYPYVAEDGRENLDGNESRVLRGGSWSDDQDDTRADYRYGRSPDYRRDLGFRVVVRSPSLQNH